MIHFQKKRKRKECKATTYVVTERRKSDEKAQKKQATTKYNKITFLNESIQYSQSVYYHHNLSIDRSIERERERERKRNQTREMSLLFSRGSSEVKTQDNVSKRERERERYIP